MALAAHPAVGNSVNQAKAVRLLTNNPDNQPASLLEGLTPLHPGQLLTVDSGQVNARYFYRLNATARVELASDEDYAAEFRRLLNQAVTRRLRSTGKVGAMLSGGMDSVPMSILAAQAMAQQGQALPAYTWTFDRFPEADERDYVSAVCQDFAIEPNWVSCDDVWPQLDGSMTINPLVPYGSPYAAFTHELMSRAQSHDVRVLLSGMGGDMLYSGLERSLLELLRRGQWRQFLQQGRKYRQSLGSTWTLLKRFFVAPSIPRRWQQERLQRPHRPGYLTARAQALLTAEPHFLGNEMFDALRPQQYVNVAGSLEGEDAAYGRFVEAEYGLERRYPFRDRDLAEFMLGVPSRFLFFDLIERPIVKKAFESDFPALLMQRNGKTDFSSVINAGIRQDQVAEGWLEHPEKDWDQTVNKRYIDRQHPEFERFLVVKWQCSYYEYWKSVCYTS